MPIVTRKANDDNLKKSAELQGENNKLLKSNAKYKKIGLIIGLLSIGVSVLVYFLGVVS